MKPILLGKLKRYPSGRHALIAGEGNLKSVEASDAPLLRRMDGFSTLDEIAAASDVSVEAVQAVYDRYEGELFLVPLDRWNKLRWCPESQTYVNSLSERTSPVTGGPLVDVPLSPPCDPWFCTGDELVWLREIIETRLGHDLPPQALLLANNGLRDGTFFWEVVADGRIVLRIDFTGATAQDWAITFATAFDGVDWTFGARAATWLEERDRHIHANERSMKALVADSVAFIEEICSRNDEALPLIYFSGGKESMVTMQLFKEASVKAQLLFAAVGMDFPEDSRFIHEFQTWLRESPEYSALFELHIEEGDPERVMELFARNGSLELGNMWCRGDVKYPIRNRAVERLYPDGAPIAFEGSRWYENDFRRSHPRVNFVTDIKGYRRSQQIWAHACADWNGFDIWSAMYLYGLPVNPLYEQGFQRTTCWSCPLVNPYHIEQSKRYHGDLWERIEAYRVRGFEDDETGHVPTETPF